MCVLRSSLRYRDELVCARSVQCQHRQKALQPMNVPLHPVFSDVTGVSGWRILEAILAGERDVQKLAARTDRRARASLATIEKALCGDDRPEHLFVLQCAYDLYQTYDKKIRLCDEQVIAQMAPLPTRADKPVPPRKAGRPQLKDRVAGTDLREELFRLAGVDWTAIEGIGPLTTQVILSEIGLDMSAWRSEKHFASWLGLCPDHRISGGKILSRRTRRVLHPVADAWRVSATTLQRSQTALGAFYRRMRAKLGAASALTATAHKLARLIYRLLKHGELYVQQGLDAYEAKYRARLLHNVKKSAAALGFELTPAQAVSPSVS